jgi:hypothetical protein
VRALDLAPRDLETLDSVWDSGLGSAYDAYRPLIEDSRVALAAALVETGIRLQGVGSHVAAPGQLLLGDLCLARASRLLADIADQRLQIAFARVVERVSSEAAAAGEASDLRRLLRGVLSGRR